MIKFNNVTHKYGNNIILRNLTYTFNSNGLYIITGESGCGKTTILDLLYKLIKPTQGKIINNNIIAYDAITNLFLTDDTVLDNLKNILKIQNNEENYPLVEEYLDILNIKGCKHKKIKHLSVGQRRRVGIIATLALDCDFYLLDEPFADIDKYNRMRVTSLIEKKLNEGRSIIITSHQTELLNNYQFSIFKVNDRINIYSYESNLLVKRTNEKKSKKFFYNDLILSKLKIRYFILSLMIALLSISLIFVQSQENYTRNYIDSNIYVLYNTNEALLNYYDYTFDYIQGDLNYSTLNFQASSSVIALPVSLYQNQYILNENEILISKIIYENYQHVSFESLGIDKPDKLKGKNVTFDNESYIVKDVLDIEYNVVYLSDEKLRNKTIYISSRPKTLEIIKEDMILKEGKMPQDNARYFEIIGDENCYIGDIINDLFLVTGISNDNKFYLRYDDFKLYYLQNTKSNKIVYSNDKIKIESFLTISSIAYENLHDQKTLVIENELAIQKLSNQSLIFALKIITIIVILIIGVLEYIRIRKRINIHRFMKTNSVIILANLIINSIIKFIFTIIISILVFIILRAALVYVVNTSYLTKSINLLIKYNILALGLFIIVIDLIFMIYNLFNKMNIFIRKN